VLANGLLVGMLIILLAAFFGFYRTGNVTGLGITLILMAAVSVSVLLFAPIEHWILFHIDTNSSQGDMQFLLPKKATSILGAKVLVVLLRTMILYGLFFTVVPYCERLVVENYGLSVGYVGKVLDTIMEMTHSANATLAPMIGVWLCLALFVLLLSNLGLFVVAVPPPLENLRGLTRFAGYIVAFALIIFVEMKISELLLFITSSPIVVDVFEIVYLIGVNLVLFFGTARLLEKRVSI